MTSAIQKNSLDSEAALRQSDLSAVACVGASRPRPVILVAIGFRSPSRASLRWAAEFARRAGHRLRLVSAASAQLLMDPLRPASQQRWHRDSWLGSLREALQDWAWREGGVWVPSHEVRVADGEPVRVICQEAEDPDVKMVILGEIPSQMATDKEQLPQALLRHCPRPMLLLGPRGQVPAVVAATDCSDPALPVLHEAWGMASALRKQTYIVHNVDRLASQFGERIGMPLTPALADCVAQHHQAWLERMAAVSDVIITREADIAQGVLGTARALEADLLVVGVKPQEKARHRTAERILMQTQRSVLFVPIADRPVPGLARTC